MDSFLQLPDPGLDRCALPSQFQLPAFHALWDPELLPVRADPGKMKQGFLNLILNAQDAMPKGGALTLVTRNTKRREVLVIVADTGVGIPKERFPEIFEPFYTTKEGGLGAGLGLSVVHGIIGDHQGVIKVHSVEGRGTCFTIRLPAYKWGENDVAALRRSASWSWMMN